MRGSPVQFIAIRTFESASVGCLSCRILGLLIRRSADSWKTKDRIGITFDPFLAAPEVTSAGYRGEMAHSRSFPGRDVFISQLV
jgi:hypothetical protein